MKKWWDKINWTRVLAVALIGLTLAGYFAAVLLEGQYVQWFLGFLGTLILFRVETLNAKIDSMTITEEHIYE